MLRLTSLHCTCTVQYIQYTHVQSMRPVDADINRVFKNYYRHKDCTGTVGSGKFEAVFIFCLLFLFFVFCFLFGFDLFVWWKSTVVVLRVSFLCACDLLCVCMRPVGWRVVGFAFLCFVLFCLRGRELMIAMPDVRAGEMSEICGVGRRWVPYHTGKYYCSDGGRRLLACKLKEEGRRRCQYSHEIALESMRNLASFFNELWYGDDMIGVSYV